METLSPTALDNLSCFHMKWTLLSLSELDTVDHIPSFLKYTTSLFWWEPVLLDLL